MAAMKRPAPDVGSSCDNSTCKRVAHGSNSMKIPVVDFGAFGDHEGIVAGDAPTTAQLSVAKQIDAVCREHGFLCLTNFGVSPDLVSRVFAASKALFALPEESKRCDLARIRPETNMGYQPFATGALNKARPPDRMEAFNVRSFSVYHNDFRGCSEGFGQVSREFWDAVMAAARRYSLACALALGLEPDYFSKTLNSMDLNTIRFLHYPPCDFDETADVASTCTSLRLGEHTDFGLFTMLFTDVESKGLQVKPVRGGEVGGGRGGEEAGWFDLEIPSAQAGQLNIVVNTGALLARWTNDVWRATAHRVVVPNRSVAERSRFSIACFLDPDAITQVVVHPKFVPDGEEPKYSPINAKEYLLMKLRDAQKGATK